VNRVLIIEDDADICLSLRYAFEQDGGFSVFVAHDGERGLREARRSEPDVVLLDLNLPGMDGSDVCRELRRDPRTSTVPIIMVTARVEEADVIDGLTEGADDYITKPFSVKEVVARAHAVLRRVRTIDERPRVLSHGAIRLDEARRRVRVGEAEVVLTRKEFDLLADLLRRPGRVASREQLLERVWGYDHPGTTRTVDVHVRQLRKKLGPQAAEAIETVVGVGYRLRSDD
jgi:two-component system phosphate regulon response regulator PhoB